MDARKQFRELIYGWHVVHKRNGNQGVVGSPKTCVSCEKNLFIVSLSFSLFFSLVILTAVALHVFAHNEISSKAFILTLSIQEATVQIDLTSLIHDVCDLITIAIRNENLQFRIQSIRKFRLSMVITNSNCNL